MSGAPLGRPWTAEFDPVEHLDKPPLAGIPRPAARGERSASADVILARQENLDREIRVGQQRRERNELVEHLDRRRTLRRATNRHDLAVLVDADDPTFSRDRVHDANTMLIKQRIELPAQGREAARLHLDQLAIGTNQVDHELANGTSNPVIRCAILL